MDKVPIYRQDAGRALGASRCNSDGVHEHQIDVNRPVLFTAGAGSERSLGWSELWMEMSV
jgi:hypothetical protein